MRCAIGFCAGHREMNPVAAVLLGFAAMTAYVPGWAGAATTPRWIVIGVGSWLLFFFADRVTFTLAHVAGLVLVVWCVVTLAWSADIDSGIGALLLIIALVGVFALASVTDNPRPVMAGAAAGIAVSSAIVIVQWTGWSSDLLPSYFSYRPAALFFNANYMGEAAALVIVGCLAYRLFTGALIAAPALLLSSARGAMLAVIAVAVAWLWHRGRAKCALALATAIVVLGLCSADGIGMLHRIAIWSDTERNITLAGHGLGSFWVKFPAVATATDLSKERPERAHNEVLDVAFETGVVGAALLCIFALTFVGPLNPARFVLIALAVEAMLAFPLHMPATAFLGAFMAGHCARDRLRLRDQVRVGRDRIRAWLDTRRRRAILVRGA